MVRIVKKSEERKSDIVEAAKRLFQTKNYEKTTMQDVMDALGIAKGTIYHYFKSKEALLEAVVEHIVDNNIQEMQVLVKSAKGNALEKLRMLVEKGRIIGENAEIIEELHRPGNASMHIRLLAATLQKQAPLYAQLIEQGCKEGIFHTDAPLECAEFVLSGVQFLTDMGIYPWKQEDLIRRMQAFPKLIEKQLQAPPGSFEFLTYQS
jgi:AcrR family transcriptional regulator